MNNEVIQDIVLAVIHAAEHIFGCKIATEERTRFKAFLSGEGEGITLTGKSNAAKVLAAQKRGDWLYFRLALSPDAARNGCIESAKRWAEDAAKRIGAVGRGCNIKNLTVGLYVVIDRGGPTPEFVGRMLLNKT